MEISTKVHLLELFTMIHVVRKQIKCLLVKERPRDISLARLRDLICCVYQSVKIQYSQALANPKRETISHNSLLEALAFKETHIYRYNPLYRNICSNTNLVQSSCITEKDKDKDKQHICIIKNYAS